MDRLVRFAVLIIGLGLCAVATFAEWKGFFGAVFTEAVGIALQIMAFKMKSKGK